MVGFNLIYPGIEATDSEIYIPLWSDSITLFNARWTDCSLFTFHYGRIQSDCTHTYQDRHLHLHSIMVGFNRDQVLDQSVPIRIYIPLWSDSIRTGDGYDHGAFNIYIPLWSDSIAAQTRYSRRGFRIYIPLWSDSILGSSILSLPFNSFTFHYGRIQSLFA